MRSLLCHSSASLLAIALTIPLVACSCSTNSATTPSPAAESAAGASPAEVAAAWRDALLDADVDAALQLVADDFASSQWATRAELAEYLETARARGFFSGGAPLVASEDPAGRMHAISMRSAMGTSIWNLEFGNPDTAHITSARLEIY